MEKIDTLIINCKAYSMNKPNETYNWIAIKNGLIIDIGENNSYTDLMNYANEVINLKGSCVLPGFYDCHAHVVQTGLNLRYGVELSGAKSISEVLYRIKQYSSKVPEQQIIYGVHMDINSVKEKRYPLRKELDYACPNHGVLINSREFHTSVINSQALSIVDLPYNIEGISRDERNLPAGILRGKASAFVRNRIYSLIDNNIRRECVTETVQKGFKKGITTIHAMEGGYTFHRYDADFVLENGSTFPIDLVLYYQSFDIKKVLNNGLPRIGGDLFLDGSFYSYTAALLNPYNDNPKSKGNLYYNDNELVNFLTEAKKHSIQTAFHAIGPRAIKQILKAHDYTFTPDSKKQRHRIEHFELADDNDIYKAKKLGLIISVQPVFEYRWGNNSLYDMRLGINRSKKTNQFKKYIDMGLVLCGGSDSDVTEMDPMLGIHSAVNHPKKESSIDLYNAVKLYTVNGAYSSFEDNKKGTIALGKYCDLVVLNKDIFNINNSSIKDIKILMTIKQGNIIYKSDEEDSII